MTAVAISYNIANNKSLMSTSIAQKRDFKDSSLASLSPRGNG